MARYTPEFIAALRHRYEDTDEPLRLIFAEFKISMNALYKLIQQEGWTLRSRRLRKLRPAAHLVEDVIALANRPAPQDAAGAANVVDTTAAEAPGADAALDRVKAFLLARLAAEQAAPAADSEHSARTVSILLRALKSLRELRGEPTPAEPIANDDDDDDMPRDIDEFRRELARRINAFVDSRTDRRDAADAAPEDVDKA